MKSINNKNLQKTTKSKNTQQNNSFGFGFSDALFSIKNL
jgi:hypothetical protein